MSLRDEINSSPRGTKAALIKATGLNKLTIIRATAGTQCGAASAELIAKAFGAPERWAELIVIRRRPPSQGLPPDEAVAEAS